MGMDVFEQWLDTFWQMPARGRKEYMAVKKAACTCPKCPSYNRCAEGSKELVYCITGKSPLCIAENHGCTCTDCAVPSGLGLKYRNFCTGGSEAAQRYEHEVH